MLDQIEQIKESFKKKLEEVKLESLEELRVAYFGRNGHFKKLNSELKSIEPEFRNEVAKAFNTAKSDLEQKLEEIKFKLEKEEMVRELLETRVDVTLPETPITRSGSLHPVSHVIHKSIIILEQLGFEYRDGPDIETPFYNFDSLNIPKEHPARELQDTFWVENNLVLRTHTTPIQARVLEECNGEFPIKVVAAGRVYRNEATDATHLSMFHQIEGFWLDENITFSDLKGVLSLVAKELFGNDLLVRFKPKYYPYTEPSVGLDIQCSFCRGKGCQSCHGVGWVTIMGAGMIHKNVLDIFNIDSKRIKGIAFGWGATRMASQAVGLEKVSLLYNGDVRVLEAIHRGHVQC